MAGCHGTAGDRHDEYLIWSRRDPHARAGTLLLNEQSVNICRNLGITTPPSATDRCLRCHVDYRSKGHHGAIDNGVSCESCHGVADEWRYSHTQIDWSSLTQPERLKQRQAEGIADTITLAARAQACVRCHVGSADPEVGAQVDHDLIAAGHPELKFEFNAYHTMLPKHWNYEAEAEADPHFHQQAWLTGQQIALAAQLELMLSTNATAGIHTELSFFTCTNCHQDILATGVGKPASQHNLFQLNTWYWAGVRNVSPELDEHIGGMINQLNRPASTNDEVDARLSSLQKALTQKVDAGSIQAEQREKLEQVKLFLYAKNQDASR